MKKINDSKKQASIALKKAQSHIKKILQMIEEDEYCIDIMEQMLAVNGLIKSASNKIMKNHLQSCFANGMNSKNGRVKDKLIDEVAHIMSLTSKN